VYDQQKAAALHLARLFGMDDPFSVERPGLFATPTQSFGGRRRIDHQGHGADPFRNRPRLEALG